MTDQPKPTAPELFKRVDHLEDGVNNLQSKMIRLETDVSSTKLTAEIMSAQLDKVLANQEKQQEIRVEEKKFNPQLWLSLGAFLILAGGVVFFYINKNDADLKEEIITLRTDQKLNVNKAIDSADMRGYQRAMNEVQSISIANLEKRMDETSRTRFTDKDGEELKSEIIELRAMMIEHQIKSGSHTK